MNELKFIKTYIQEIKVAHKELRKENKDAHHHFANRLSKGDKEFSSLKTWNIAMRLGLGIVFVALGYIIFG